MAERKLDLCWIVVLLLALAVVILAWRLVVCIPVDGSEPGREKGGGVPGPKITIDPGTGSGDIDFDSDGTDVDYVPVEENKLNKHWLGEIVNFQAEVDHDLDGTFNLAHANRFGVGIRTKDTSTPNPNDEIVVWFEGTRVYSGSDEGELDWRIKKKDQWYDLEEKDHGANERNLREDLHGKLELVQNAPRFELSYLNPVDPSEELTTSDPNQVKLVIVRTHK